MRKLLHDELDFDSATQTSAGKGKRRKQIKKHNEILMATRRQAIGAVTSTDRGDYN